MQDQAPNMEVWETIFVKIILIRPTGIASSPIIGNTVLSPRATED